MKEKDKTKTSKMQLLKEWDRGRYDKLVSMSPPAAVLCFGAELLADYTNNTCTISPIGKKIINDAVTEYYDATVEKGLK